MDNVIDVSIPVAQVIDQHPEVLDLLVELGFKPLANPIMRNTVGRKVSLKHCLLYTSVDFCSGFSLDTVFGFLK